MSIENEIQEPTLLNCRGCDREVEKPNELGYSYCLIYLDPTYHWRHGPCQGATHLNKPELTKKEKKRVGQKHQVKAVRLSTKQQQTYSRVKAPE